jgi:hypothetical protein
MQGAAVLIADPLWWREGWGTAQMNPVLRREGWRITLKS